MNYNIIHNNEKELCKVILISGKAQHGKDTSALLTKEVLEQKGKRVLIAHYADLLKFICRTYFDWNGEKDEEGRRLLQYVGTDVIRKENPSLWVDFVATMLKYFGDNWDYVIIPDCRFPNEVTCMTEQGFKTTHIRVLRTDFNSPLTEEQQQHPSETALDGITPDYWLHNGGTIEDLKISIFRMINESPSFRGNS